MEARDQTLPQGHWAFDESVTTVFDDMLKRSIPQYEVMRQTVFDLACQFIQSQTDVVDLGCSRGESMARLVDRFGLPREIDKSSSANDSESVISRGGHNRFIGVEVSPPMLAACRERFKGLIACGVVDIRDLDLRTNYPPVKASVTLCVLTLQFTPIEYRQQILKRIYDHTMAGGALILVEKVIGATASLDNLMVDRYYDLKAEHGYSQEQIQRKRLSLEGVLVPVTARWNEELLHLAGFREIDCFWRWMNFAGWLAVKAGA